MDLPDSPRLLSPCARQDHLKNYSDRTEQAYVDWIKRFIWFHDKRHLSVLGAADIEAFLTALAAVQRVARADTEPG